jgi:hypothetical protein
MEIRTDEVEAICDNCGRHTYEVFVLSVGNGESYLCFSCVIKLRDLCHEATCEKDVTGKCDCWEGEDERL